MHSGRTAQRVLRQVEGQTHRVRQPVEDIGQVIARAGSHVDDGLRCRMVCFHSTQTADRRVAYDGAKPGEMASPQEGLPGGHHAGVVRGGGARIAREEVHVALAGDVEGVPGRAA